MGFELIMVAMLLAFLYGLFGKPPQKLQRLLERSLTITIYGLIFVMGISLGQDTAIFEKLPQLGLVSAGFAVATVLGSLIGVILVRPLLDLTQTAMLPQKEKL